MHVSFHPRASNEVEEAQAWYEERSLLAAAGFLHEISVAVRRISKAPNRYPVSVHGTRRILPGRFPFGIHYRVNENELGGSFPVLQTLGDHAQRERLNASDSVVAVLAVGHDADRAGSEGNEVS